tara:strand:+ start:55 stop:636 length:582 start_codon:yes stop_codon:yes gene_type:complete
MALWGNNDNVTSAGIITAVDYANKIVYGQGTAWSNTGSAQVGDVLKIGSRGGGGTYYGDVVITEIATTTRLSIAATESLVKQDVANLDPVHSSFAGTSFVVNQQPKYWSLQQHDDYFRGVSSEFNSDVFGYGVSDDSQGDTADTAYATSAGWVGVQTYMGVEGELRVKKEVFVAMSGITTGANGVAYPTEEVG